MIQDRELLMRFPAKIVIFIDLFMGSGAVSFAMAERCQQVIANENDNDVFNRSMPWKSHAHGATRVFFKTLAEPPRNMQFLHTDFRQTLSIVSFQHDLSKGAAFVFANTSEVPGFSEQDSRDLFAVLLASGIRFAMSEFRNPFILEQAAQHGLCVTSIDGERIFITNLKQ